MKRIFLSLLFVIGAFGIADAQRYIVVDSEKIFTSIAEYNNALTAIDNLAKQEQKKVEEMFADIETIYNNYVAQKAALSESSRNRIEELILSKEQKATEYQKSVFGSDGSLMKQRIEKIQPIQKRVFAAIEKYAKDNGYDIVLDKASNPSILYSAESADHTAAIIELVK